MLPRTFHAPSQQAIRKRLRRRIASFAVLACGALFALTAVSPDAVDLSVEEQLTAAESTGSLEIPEIPTGDGFSGGPQITR